MQWSSARATVGVLALLAAVIYLGLVVDLSDLRRAAAGVAAAPGTLAAAMAAYAVAFGLRAWSWCRVLPALGLGQSWAALHVSLLGNHLLPLRLGEALRVTSVLRRTDLQTQPVLASAVLLRVGDLLAVVALAAVLAPAAVIGVVGGTSGWGWAAGVTSAVVIVASGTLVWLRRLAKGGAPVRLPGPTVAGVAVGAWLLESSVVLAVAGAAGLPLTYGQAVAVTAVTIAAQTVALTPGGIGSYEAAGTAALVGLGAPPGHALAVVLLTHAIKTAYALGVGSVALVLPAPGYWGRWRLPRRLPERPAPVAYAPQAPVVAFLPAHDEQDRVGKVVAGLPRSVAARPVVVVVVDDGSTDATAAEAERAGARVVRLGARQGLGAAVRRGLVEAVALTPACVVYLDADGEYAPTDLPLLAAPVLSGAADYVVGSRFAGDIDHMPAHRRFGNLMLTAWVRWMTRRGDLSDAQSGYRAFSPAAAAEAEVVHDYNYAQVLTLDLMAKGFRYAEVPIGYSFRTGGTSFVRLPTYLRRVLPAVHAELNAAPGPTMRHSRSQGCGNVSALVRPGQH